MSGSSLLKVCGLRVAFTSHGRRFVAVQDVSFTVGNGESIGIVGESGSGKSTVARSILGLLQGGVRPIEKAEISVEGQPIAVRNLPRLRGNTCAMVFQDPLSYLNPLMTIGKQIGEAVKRHDPSVKVRARIDDLLELVQLPTTVSASYPHELSGGMRQRVLIAIALGCRPKLLIADEPTTALDVTTQKEILLLLKGLQQKLGMAMILISHDLAVVSEMCERVYVMHRGRVIESGLAQEIFGAPAHPYTQGLVAASQAVQDENGRFVSMDGVTVDDGELIACPYVVSEGHEANGNIASYQAPQVDGESIHYSRVWRMEAA